MRWQILTKITEDFKSKFPEINPIILQLLANRGLKTQEEIDEFLMPDYSQDLNDPFIFQEMEKAVGRIYKAIREKEKILIYGDYDTDGVVSTVILYQTFKKIGAEVETYLPDREKEGYGLNKEAIGSFKEKGINLIITCDCGISNVEEIEEAKKAGIETIITDHHREPKILPDAFVIIDPWLKREKYPFKELAGVGVAFKLIQSLLQHPNSQLDEKEAFEKWLLDLVALGTIADSMPLLKENRVLCKYGLIVLNKTKNPGLKFLIEKAGLRSEIDAEKISYQLSPRLNVSGRMDHANQSLKLLLAEKQEALKLASEINNLNVKRQKLIEEIFNEIKSEIGEGPKEKILVIFKEKALVGLLGLLANKLLDVYHRPALVLTKNSNGKIKASGRSIEEFDLFSSLSSLVDYFEDFGGHAQAAGFTLKNPDDFEKFKKEIEKIVSQKIKDEDLIPQLEIETEVDLPAVNWDLYEELLKFEPFGKDNPKPYFLLSNIYLRNIEIVGQNQNHRRLTLEDGRKMIYFNSEKKVEDLKIGDQINVVFELGVNEWNGERSLEMKVVDLRKHL